MYESDQASPRGLAGAASAFSGFFELSCVEGTSFPVDCPVSCADVKSGRSEITRITANFSQIFLQDCLSYGMALIHLEELGVGKIQIKEQPRHPLVSMRHFRSYPPRLSYSETESVSSCRSARGEYRWSLPLQKVLVLQPQQATPRRSYRR